MDRLLEYMGHHPLLVVAAVVAGLLVLAHEYFLKVQGANAVSPQQLIQLMNQGALVLDVRGEEQFAAGHIGGARQLPEAQVARAAETLKKHREKPVVICAEGDTRGPAVVRALTAQGFTRAFCLRGGIGSWRAENLPLAKGSA